MANQTPIEAKLTRTPPRPKPKVMQAALLMWAHRIYHSADEAVRYAGGYAGAKEDPAKFKVYSEILDELRALAQKYDAMAGKTVVRSSVVTGGCEDDQDCPDDQICVHGTCEPLFPEG